MRIRDLAMGLAVVAATAVPASAQVVHSVNFGLGLFNPRGADSRVPGDVLVRDMVGQPLPAIPDLTDALAFEIGDFRSFNLFGEWNISFGDHIEVGAGVSAFGQSVPTVYLDLVDEQGREIEQTLRLRVIPITGVVRFLPFGRAGDFQPYVGAGFGMFPYRYSEFGRFVDPDTLDIFEDKFEASGVAPGGVVLGGIKIPLGGDVYGLTGEWRYHFASGDTGGIEAGFLDEKIDLSGFVLNVGFNVRF